MAADIGFDAIRKNNRACWAELWKGRIRLVEKHTDTLGIGVADRSGTTLTLNPDDCFGAVWSFTDSALPGDPRGA